MTPAIAATAGDISQVDSFIRSIIKVIAGLAGLIATGFFAYQSPIDNLCVLHKAKMLNVRDQNLLLAVMG